MAVTARPAVDPGSDSTERPAAPAGRRLIGIVLAAGAALKERPAAWIEPDPEGKLRCLAALDDLQRGQLEQVFMLGGLRVYGRSVTAY